MGPLSAVASTLSDWALEVGGLTASLLLGVGGVVGNNHKRSKKNERYLEGSDDPNNEGVLEIANDTRDRVSDVEDNLTEFRRETQLEHRQVMNRLEELSDQVEDGQ